MNQVAVKDPILNVLLQILPLIARALTKERNLQITRWVLSETLFLHVLQFSKGGFAHGLAQVRSQKGLRNDPQQTAVVRQFIIAYLTFGRKEVVNMRAPVLTILAILQELLQRARIRMILLFIPPLADQHIANMTMKKDDGLALAQTVRLKRMRSMYRLLHAVIVVNIRYMAIDGINVVLCFWIEQIAEDKSKPG